ncbi:MAG: TerC family protein [Verrucomicrobiales bacterium]|nr:TerC family protein [Verrucomicrobiales bacterium]
MDTLLNPDLWIGLAILTLLEIVLGIDNLIFISILSGKLPEDQRSRARRIGLSLALITRILLLLSLAWVMRLDKPFWATTVAGHDIGISGKDLILLVGGLFLIGKSTYEIHEKLEGADGEKSSGSAASFQSVVIQILLLDIVFSLDSVITAVGTVKQVSVMITAVVLSMVVMLVFVNQIGTFVERHPTIKMLALAFLILIGTMLVAEGFHQHIPRGYIYFAMAFSVGVELLNMRIRSSEKVKLHQPYR